MSKESKEFDPRDLNVDQNLLNSDTIKGRLDIEALVFRQILATNMAASQDELIFAANVRVLLSMIPSQKRAEIAGRSEEYTSTESHYEYKYCCGTQMGTPENPIYGSPYEVSNDVVDWHGLYEIILHALEEVGVSWKSESWTIEAKAQSQEIEVIKKPTPVFTGFPETSPQTSSTEAQTTTRHYNCPVCQQHIQLGTGQRLLDPRSNKIRTVHKSCIDVAKSTWLMG